LALGRRLHAGTIDPSIQAGRCIGLPRLFEKVKSLTACRKVNSFPTGILGKGSKSLLKGSRVFEPAASLGQKLAPSCAFACEEEYRQACYCCDYTC